MSSQVPAWKRLGLELKPTDEALAPQTLTDANEKIAKKRPAAREKKPPKRVKLPKLERKPAPEKDQLAYLRQFHNDRAAWKFSKQKQNWILRNLAAIPSDYEEALVEYVKSIQGGARRRVVGDLEAVVVQWRKKVEELEKRVAEELSGKEQQEKEQEEQEEQEEDKPKSILKSTDESTEAGKEQGEVTEPEITEEYATRCRLLLDALKEEAADGD